MDHFIEVVGEGSYAERISKHRAEINLVVRAAQAETAIREVVELRNNCILQLKQAGMADAEMFEGGSGVGRSWYERKKAGQEASHKILFECADLPRLQSALASLEGLFENPRYTLNFSMESPVIEILPAEVQQAHRAAIENARAQAGVLAAAGGVRLGVAIQIEELVPKNSRSGMYGEDNWSHAMGVSGAALAPIQLEQASRKNTVRYRVRFGIEKAD